MAHGLAEGHVDDAVLADADGAPIGVFLEQFHGARAKAAAEDAVLRAGGAAALYVAQHGRAGFLTGERLDDGSELEAGHGVGGDILQFLVLRANGVHIGSERGERALRHHQNGGTLAVEHAPLDALGDFLDAPGGLGHHHVFRAAGQRRVHGDIAAVAAHDGDQAGALVGIAGFAHAVDALAGGIQSGIEADGEIGVFQIVIDGAGDADGGEALVGQRLEPGERAIAADADHAFHAQQVHVLDHLFLAFGLVEIQAARGHQEGAAAVDLIADGFARHDIEIVVRIAAAHEHAVVAALEEHAI